MERLGLPQPTPADGTAVHYQRVFQLTEATLAPFASLTYPSLAPGSAAWRKLKGELLGTAANQNGTLVGLALAECTPEGNARLVSLCVSPPQRRQGIGTRLIAHLSVFLTQQSQTSLSVS